MLTALPLISRVLNKITSAPTFMQVSEKSWTLDPGCESVAPPAIFHEDELSRVIGYGGDSTREWEWRRIHGGKTVHGATRAYLITEAQLLRGHVFKGRMMHRVADWPLPLLAEVPSLEIESAALASTQYGVRFFGHWLIDDLPLALACVRLAEAVTIEREMTPHQRGYMSKLCIDVRPLVNAHFRELIILDDVAQNNFKRQRLQEIRRRLAEPADRPATRGVMLLRGTSGARRTLLNESAIAKELSSNGFRVVDPQSSSADQVIDACRGAKIVIGVEGSQLSHGLLGVVDGGAMVVLQPPFHFSNAHKDCCDCLGFAYGFVVGRPMADGFIIEPREVLRIIEKVERALHIAGV